MENLKEYLEKLRLNLDNASTTCEAGAISDEAFSAACKIKMVIKDICDDSDLSLALAQDLEHVAAIADKISDDADVIVEEITFSDEEARAYGTSEQQQREDYNAGRGV